MRTPRGGGAREVSLPLSAAAKQVIEIGKGLFYLNGVSYYGNILDTEFSCQLLAGNN